MHYTIVPPEIGEKLSELYKKMEAAYDAGASARDFSCDGCPDNCCDSYFLHHTYLEWAYLWEGLRLLPSAVLLAVEARSVDAIRQRERAILRGETPLAMCPLNIAGRCTLYEHRLMICRLHGTPSSLTRPDGKTQRFPGCFRCQELVQATPRLAAAPDVDRTPFFVELASLEANFLVMSGTPLPRV